jgi:molybdate transport system ATP-binding protein
MIEARIRRSFGPGRESAPFTLDIDFRAQAGVTVLFGPSGAGKTLTLDCIAGFERPNSGRILVDNRILFDAEARVHLTPQQRHCGYVFQNYALFPHMTLRRNLEFAAERVPRLERHRRVNEMLERFRIADVAGRRPHEVSGGQKQRCSIARALIGDPSLLLLDEPARGLDAPLRADLYGVLRQVRSEFKTPVLLVTHDVAECLELGDQMLLFRDGRIVQSGTPRQVIEQPSSMDVARLLGLYNIIPAEITALDPGRNSSRLRIGETEIDGPYFPGHLRGDRIHVCAMPSRLTAAPRMGRPGPCQLPARLVRATPVPSGVRLEFENEIAVECRSNGLQPVRPGEEWLIDIPPSALKIL